MVNIVRQDDVRRQNQYSILSALRRSGSLSRTAMSAHTGLSASTVTVITNNLLERGVIADQIPENAVVNKRGRPQVMLVANGGFATVAVLRLARGLAEGALYDYAGRQLASHEVRQTTGLMTAEGVIESAAGIVSRLLADTGGDRQRLMRITIAAEGIIDGAGRELLSAPVSRVHHVAIADALEAKFGVPTEILNDCNAVTEALFWRAPDRYGENLVAVLLSMGIGAGLRLNGRMFSGQKSSAMEFGHMIYKPDGALCRCGRRGCIEAYAGIYAIWRAANGDDPNVLPDEEPSRSVLATLIEKARASDGPERRALKEAGKAVGTGLVNLFTLFDSVPLAFTGSGTAALEFMMEEIRQVFDNRSFGLKVEPEIVDVYPDAPKLMREGALMRSLIAIDRSLPDQGELVIETAGQRHA